MQHKSNPNLIKKERLKQKSALSGNPDRCPRSSKMYVMPEISRQHVIVKAFVIETKIASLEFLEITRIAVIIVILGIRTINKVLDVDCVVVIQLLFTILLI